jgi:serine/threonine protein kinase
MCEQILRCLGNEDNLSTWSESSFKSAVATLYKIKTFTPIESLFEEPVEREFLDILKEMLVFNPADRITVRQLLFNKVFDKIRRPENE